MGDNGPGGRRLPCPCSVRRARAVRMRAVSALAAAGLVALAVLGTTTAPVRAQPAASSVSVPQGYDAGSAAGRITLIAVVVIALGVFAVLQVMARSQRQRRPAFADWRTWPPGYDPWAGVGDPAAGQHEGSAYRPGFGFLPGHGLAAPPARSAGGRWMRDPARLGYLCQDSERQAKPSRECRPLGPARAIGAGERPATTAGSLSNAKFRISTANVRKGAS